MRDGSGDAQPLVSIVLPTFNRAHLLDGAIRSAVDQTWGNLELIVVDDGSTDDTMRIGRAMADRDHRVRYVRQENGRIPRALNTGFAVARGELLTWTSDDNLLEPNTIEVLATFLLRHEDVGLAYCDTKFIDENGAVIGRDRLPPPTELEERNVVGSCFMYRRTVAEKVGEYDPSSYLAEDYDYWLRIAKVARIAHVEDACPYRYRVHSASLTSRYGPEAELQAARVRVRHATSRARRRAAMAGGFCRAATELRRIGRFGKAMSYYLRSLLILPLQTAAYRGLVAASVRHRPRMHGETAANLEL